jgi:hypothetical protein
MFSYQGPFIDDVDEVILWIDKQNNGHYFIFQVFDTDLGDILRRLCLPQSVAQLTSLLDTLDRLYVCCTPVPPLLDDDNTSLHAFFELVKMSHPSLRIIRCIDEGFPWAVYPLEEQFCSEIQYETSTPPPPDFVFKKNYSIKALHHYLSKEEEFDHQFESLANLKTRVGDALVRRAYIVLPYLEEKEDYWSYVEWCLLMLESAIIRYGDNFFAGMTLKYPEDVEPMLATLQNRAFGFRDYKKYLRTLVL